MSDEATKALEAAVREAFLEEAAELLRRIDLAENALGGAGPEGRVDALRAIARALHTLKGAAAASGEDAIKHECHAIEGTVSAIEAGTSVLDEASARTIGEGVARLHRLLAETTQQPAREASRPAAPTIDVRDLASATVANDVIRVKPERIDALHALASELVVLRLQSDAQLRRLSELREALGEVASSAERIVQLERRERTRASGSTSARVARALATLAGELVATHAELAEITGQLARAEADVGTVSGSLLDGVGDLRMMPLTPFFESFVGVARDAAKEMASDVRVSIRAEGAELDRSVLTRLREPLLHLVRNAVAHGIERRDQRAMAGKASAGHVLLEGRSEGARAVIRVVDDGAGIDVGAVRARAEALGLLEAGDADGLDGERLFEILSRPGFSTRAEVDRLAGRGVGLDVVADVMRALGGKVSIETVRGAGTSITLEVPVTASTSSGLLVRCGEHRFAILLSHVERVIRVRGAELARSAAVTTTRVEGEPVAVASLAALLDVDGDPLVDGTTPGVVIALGRQRLVFLVDELPGEQSLVVRPMPEAFARASRFVGAAVQEDGAVLPVLDVVSLFELAVNGSGDRRSIPSASESSDPHGRHVLVVDDSVTMRTLLRNILRSAGYEVSVAHDGRAALEVLDAGPRIDLVVSDLEMPELDGAGLCRAIRGSRHEHLPIVMVTSVSSAEEKHRAIVAGADAYVVKSEFSQDAFLELVRRMVRRDAA